jgi:hypothetical protein
MNARTLRPDDPHVSASDILGQTERILASRHFRSAKSLERFLRHVVEKKLNGEENSLKEYSIGLEVFHRGVNYDPKSDAVVRVQATLLRKKLAAYYAEEGLNDPILLDLPKGHYVANFHVRSKEAESIGEASATAANFRKPRKADRWIQIVRIAATFLVGLLTAFAYQHWQGTTTWARHSGPSVRPTEKGSAVGPMSEFPLWEKFLEAGASNILAYGTPQFFSSNGIYFRDVRVNSTEEVLHQGELRTLQKVMQTSLQPADIYTGVGETNGVYLVSQFFWGMSSSLKVTRTRQVGWQDLKNSNLIFLSSMRFQTLAKDLPYPSDFVINSGVEGHVTNLRPQPGEESEYRRGTAAGTERDYSVITLWPGKQPNRRVMALSGNTTWGTQAAAEYVTEAEHLRTLNIHLAECNRNRQRSRHAPFFQILIAAEVRDSQPLAVSYITHHDLDIVEPGA